MLIVVDLEATCWDDSRPRSRMEIIEIGAVRLDSSLSTLDEFSAFVRPVVEPVLTAFCTRLTSITQADVDDADMFPVAFERFLEWIGVGHRLCSWGGYDVKQFRMDCTRHGLIFPEWFHDEHINIKTEFAGWKGVRRCGMDKALEILRIPLVGTHHRGIDDARNTARIAQLMFTNRPIPAVQSSADAF